MRVTQGILCMEGLYEEWEGISLKDAILSNNGDSRPRISQKHQEKERSIRAKDGEIGAKMNFEGVSRHMVYVKHGKA